MKLQIPKYRDGEIRTKSKFLWFPKHIDGDFRWFEYATWEDRYYSSYTTDGRPVSDGTWFAKRWIDDTE